MLRDISKHFDVTALMSGSSFPPLGAIERRVLSDIRKKPKTEVRRTCRLYASALVPDGLIPFRSEVLEGVELSSDYDEMHLNGRLEMRRGNCPAIIEFKPTQKLYLQLFDAMVCLQQTDSHKDYIQQLDSAFKSYDLSFPIAILSICSKKKLAILTMKYMFTANIFDCYLRYAFCSSFHSLFSDDCVEFVSLKNLINAISDESYLLYIMKSLLAQATFFGDTATITTLRKFYSDSIDDEERVIMKILNSDVEIEFDSSDAKGFIIEAYNFIRMHAKEFTSTVTAMNARPKEDQPLTLLVYYSLLIHSDCRFTRELP